MSEISTNTPQVITASDVANYVVCPEAWRIKHETNLKVKGATERQAEGRRMRTEFLEETDLWARLRLYAKVAYVLLAIIAIIVFILEGKRITEPEFFESLMGGNSNSESE